MQGTVVGQIDVFLHKICKDVAMALFCLAISGLLSTSVFDSWSLWTVWFAQVCYGLWPYVLLLLRTDQATLFACLRLRSTCRCRCSVEMSIVVVVIITCAFRNLWSLARFCLGSGSRLGSRRSCMIELKFSALQRTGLWVRLPVDPSCWIDSAQMSHSSLQWRICRRLLWLHQGFACHPRLNQSCCRFLQLVDRSNIETRQFCIPPFVCLAVRRFDNFAIVVCRVSNFRSCFSRTDWVLLVAVCLGLPPLVVLLLQGLVLQLRCRSFSYFKRSQIWHHATFYSFISTQQKYTSTTHWHDQTREIARGRCTITLCNNNYDSTKH